ncbi:hypothetical protein CMV_009574, partial [Castanea mollissima]
KSEFLSLNFESCGRFHSVLQG